MATKHPSSRRRLGHLTALPVICAVCLHTVAPASAQPYRLAPDTKMAIAVVQWNPSKGEYQRWDALGGTFVVSPDGTIGLPVIGRLQVDDKSSAEVAARIAAELRDRAGLLSTPEVT